MKDAKAEALARKIADGYAASGIRTREQCSRIQRIAFTVLTAQAEPIIKCPLCEKYIYAQPEPEPAGELPEAWKRLKDDLAQLPYINRRLAGPSDRNQIEAMLHENAELKQLCVSKLLDNTDVCVENAERGRLLRALVVDTSKGEWITTEAVEAARKHLEENTT